MRRLSQQALKAAAFLLMLAVVLGLAGCASKRQEPKEPESKVACPQAEVLADARSVVRFQPGAGRDLTDIEYQAEVSRLKSRCRQRGGRETTMDVAVDFIGWRGPAARGATLSLPYFVAITQGEDVLAKENLNVDLRFEKEARQTTARAEVKKLPIPVKALDQPIEVLIGIQLTPEQLAYNRAHGR